ncbi:MAG: addiction module toxin, HicA family [Gammaproteobacteria bacterium]|nr:addiction module toxin, HicA family [Gammaproteobacteria bacterium]
MKAVSGKRFCTLIEDKGWELKRIIGSHHIFAKAGENARISVPVHGNRPLKIGLQKHLMKVARIDENEL